MSAPKTFTCAARPSGCSAAARSRSVVDVNGRYGLRALDIIEAYNLDGTLARATENVSIDSARRTDTGVYASVRARCCRRCRSPAACAATTSRRGTTAASSAIVDA